MLLDPCPNFSSTCDSLGPWPAVEDCLVRLMATFRLADSEPAGRSGTCTAASVFELLTDRDYGYLSKSRVAPYRSSAVAWIEGAIRKDQPIDISYDLGAGYHASIEPGTLKPSFDVGLGELFVLRQIASFARRVRSIYPPGVRFHIVIDNLCALLVNATPVAKTEAYCARFRELIELTVTSGMVDLIVESEQFRVADFRGLDKVLAADVFAVDARAHDNVARFLGRMCSRGEASARVLRYHDVIAESERLLNQVIRGIHMTQRATPDTMCFRPFPGADSRIQCGEVVLGRNVKGRLCPFLLTSQNVAAYRCQRALFPDILPPVIGEITYAERFSPTAAWRTCPRTARRNKPHERRRPVVLPTTRRERRRIPMSGICGIFSPREPSLACRDHLDRMLDAIGHRGPALRRTFLDPAPGIALGHAFAPEFSAPSAGIAPHWYEDRDLVATLDGAVFGGAPSAASGSGDVARLVTSFRADGSRFPAGLHGPFSLALWSRAARTLYLAREALGTRPLYAAHDPARSLFVFASELKCVLAHPAIERTVDPRAITAYLSFGYVPAPLSMIAGVEKVFPGHLLRIGPKAVLTKCAFWSHPPFAARTDDLDALAAETREQVIGSVSRHVNGAQRVGVYLSGGVDSTLVLCVLRLLGVSERKTFTLGFQVDAANPRYTEDLRWGARVAQSFATSHHPVMIGIDDDPRQVLPRLLRHMDEPMVTPNVYAKYFLAEAARRVGIESSLSGSGCGMIFQRYSEQKLAKIRARAGAKTSVEEIYLAARNRFVPCAEQAALLESTVDARETALEIIRRYRDGVESDDLSDVIHATILRFQGPEKSLAAQERGAVLNGVWLRHPFHDAELLRFANTIPAKYKGSEALSMLKVVLKRAFEDVLPGDVADRPRMGPPSYYWSRGELEPLARRLLSPAGLRRTGLLCEAGVRRLFDAERPGKGKSAGKSMWGLLMLQAWHELYVLRSDAFLEAFESPSKSRR
jgi:asparagine synthase (glutamine-hydrolysing)